MAAMGFDEIPYLLLPRGTSLPVYLSAAAACAGIVGAGSVFSMVWPPESFAAVVRNTG